MARRLSRAACPRAKWTSGWQSDSPDTEGPWLTICPGRSNCPAFAVLANGPDSLLPAWRDGKHSHVRRPAGAQPRSPTVRATSPLADLGCSKTPLNAGDESHDASAKTECAEGVAWKKQQESNNKQPQPSTPLAFAAHYRPQSYDPPSQSRGSKGTLRDFLDGHNRRFPVGRRTPPGAGSPGGGRRFPAARRLALRWVAVLNQRKEYSS